MSLLSRLLVVQNRRWPLLVRAAAATTTAANSHRPVPAVSVVGRSASRSVGRIPTTTRPQRRCCWRDHGGCGTSSSSLLLSSLCRTTPHPPPEPLSPARSIGAVGSAAAAATTATSRYFSTQSQQQQPSQSPPPPNPKTIKSNLRKLVQPFLLKCHPDMIVSQAAATAQELYLNNDDDDDDSQQQQQQELSDTVKDINLTAIQNLNMYLDTVQSMQTVLLDASQKAIRLPNHNTVWIDFCLLVEDATKKGAKKASKALMMSRRKIQLSLPPRSLLEVSSSTQLRTPDRTARVRQLQRHVTVQLAKLLRVAGLDVPRHVRMGYSSEVESTTTSTTNDGTYVGDARRARDGLDGVYHPNDERPFDRYQYEANQRAFCRQINWRRVDRMYRESVRDMEADIASSELYTDRHVARRRQLIASVLARIKVDREQKESRRNANGQQQQDDNPTTTTTAAATTTPSMLEELIALRRISLLLEDHFDDLNMEDTGSLWWQRLQLILTPPRPYNTSSSALYKRVKRRAGDNGFSFTLHEDSQVTMTVPLDFRDDEFIGEVQRNQSDFEEFVGDGLDDVFFDGAAEGFWQ